MFGKWKKITQGKIDTLYKRLGGFQSTNDKRYNEICNEFSLIKTVQEKHHTDIGVLQKDMQDKPYMNDLVKCDNCHCLLYKQDAIKGESRIVKHNTGHVIFGYKNGLTAEYEQKEEIETPYYCQKCQPKKEVKCNSKRKSKKSSKVKKA